MLWRSDNAGKPDTNILKIYDSEWADTHSKDSERSRVKDHTKTKLKQNFHILRTKMEEKKTLAM